MQLNYATQPFYTQLVELIKFKLGIEITDIYKDKSSVYLDFVNGEHKVNENVIIEEISLNGKKYFIIGAPSIYFQLVNKAFKQSQVEKYNQILQKQIATYEEVIKEYTKQETGNADSELCDYIFNKAKLANNDFDYIKKNEILNKIQLANLKSAVREELKKLCEDKFNKPNCTLSYIWTIYEVIISQPSRDPIIRIAFTSIREIDKTHTPIFEEILKLSRTTMLEKAGIIKPGQSYNQVFSEIDLTKPFNIRSYYLHPLNYKIRYNHNENKIFTLEDLIECSKLTCDGLGEGMADFEGLPFLAVVPISITVNSNILQSGEFMNRKPCRDNIDKKSNKSRLSVKKQAGGSFEINETKFIPIPIPDLKDLPSHAAKNASKNASTHPKLYSNVAAIKPDRLTNPEEQKNLLDQLFNPKKQSRTLSVLSTLQTASGLLFLVLYSEGKFYYCMLEICVKDYIKLTPEYKEYVKYELNDYNGNTPSCILHNTFYELKERINVHILGYTGAPILRVLVVKEFTKGDKVFTILGNECIYKLFKDMDSFFKQDKIQLTLPSPSSNLPSQIVEIPNFYGFMNPIIIDMIRTVKHFFIKMKLEMPFEGDYKEVNIYYGHNNDATQSENNNNVKYTKKNNSNHTYNKTKYNSIPFNEKTNDKNICISIGKKYILILNKFKTDELKTEYPTYKISHENFFKFTCWVLTREYVEECLEIIKKCEKENIKTPKNIPIPTQIKKNILFNLLSIHNNIEDISNNILDISNNILDITELNEHLRLHTQFVKDVFINQDPNRCKAFNPKLMINPISDINNMLLHFHFEKESIHFISMNYKNYKKELLDINNSTSIYNEYTSNGIYLMSFLNKLLTNKNYLNNKFNNPYVPSLKLGGLLTL